MGVIMFSNFNDRIKFPTGVNFYLLHGVIVGAICELVNKIVKYCFKIKDKKLKSKKRSR